eukprot:3728655-Pleurochrysis_carterae.AAC.1
MARGTGTGGGRRRRCRRRNRSTGTRIQPETGQASTQLSRARARLSQARITHALHAQTSRRRACGQRAPSCVAATNGREGFSVQRGKGEKA